MLKRVSSLKEEAHWLEEEAQCLEMAGLGKIEVAVAGLEVEGLYRLLMGAISYPSISSVPPPPKKSHHSPSATISHPLPLELAGAVPKASSPAAKDVEQALKAVSPAASQASEEALPTHMQPLCLQLGASREYTNARLKDVHRGHQTHMPHSVHMCTECIWGWGWCVPLVANHFSIQTHSGNTRKFILVSKLIIHLLNCNMY